MKEKSYVERQKEWIKENGIKVGDTVKVVRTSPGDTDGWENSWVPSMNDKVGSTISITRFNGARGIGHTGSYNYPFFVLEKVELSKFEPFEINITVETKDELRSLWHRFNLGPNNMEKVCEQITVSFPREWSLSGVWSKIDEKCKKLGMRKY